MNEMTKSYRTGVTLQMYSRGRRKKNIQTEALDRWCRNPRLEYIGRRGLSLSGSYQQGYSTAYNTRSHITVVCNGYILTHISNWNPRGAGQTLPSDRRSPPCTIRGPEGLFVFS